MAQTYVLIGPSGSGKSTVGRALAERLDVTVWNPEEDFERQNGPLTEAFVKDAVQVQEWLNRRSLEALVEPPGQGIGARVIELSPSGPLDPRIRDALIRAKSEGALVVYLDASLEVLARRSGLGAAQPGFLGTPRAWFRELNQTLASGYEGLYDRRCDTTHDDPMTVVDEIIALTAIN